MSKTIKIIISYEQNIYKDLSTMSFEFYGKNYTKKSIRNITNDIISEVILEG